MIVAPAVKAIALPAARVILVLAVITARPPATLTFQAPVRTLQLYPVAPKVPEKGPDGLTIVYLGIASVADPPGVRTVSIDPAHTVNIPVFALGVVGGVFT